MDKPHSVSICSERSCRNSCDQTRACNFQREINKLTTSSVWHLSTKNLLKPLTCAYLVNITLPSSGLIFVSLKDRLVLLIKYKYKSNLKSGTIRQTNKTEQGNNIGLGVIFLNEWQRICVKFCMNTNRILPWHVDLHVILSFELPVIPFIHCSTPCITISHSPPSFSILWGILISDIY